MGGKIFHAKETLPEFTVEAEGIYFISEQGEKIWWGSIETGETVSFDGSTVISVNKLIINHDNVYNYFNDISNEINTIGYGATSIAGIAGLIWKHPRLIIGSLATGTYTYMQSNSYNYVNTQYQNYRPSDNGIMVVTTSIRTTRNGVFNMHVRRDYYWYRGGHIRTINN